MLEDEKENLFANSLLDATIQDSGIRERSVDVIISPKAIEKRRLNQRKYRKYIYKSSKYIITGIMVGPFQVLDSEFGDEIGKRFG